MKEKLGKRILKNTLILFIYIFSIELIVRYNVGSNFLDWSTFRIALSSFILAGFISIIISNFKNIIRNIIVSIISFFIMIYAWIEINLFFYIGFFMGMGNAEQGTKVIDYIKEYISASKSSTYFTLIFFVILMLYYWYVEKKIKLHKLNKTIYFKFELENKMKKTYTYIISFLIIIVLSCSYYLTLNVSFMQNKLQSTSNTDLFVYPENSNLSVSQFGVLVYGVTDALGEIFKYERSSEFSYTFKEKQAQGTITDYTRVVDDYSWNELINNESKSTYNQLNNYFINRDITPKNDYTGKYEDKNLIIILMESVNEVAINEDLFPNIYKLYSEGTSFTNNYSPRNSCSTGNNEMTVMTGLYTINNTCTANTYKNNTYYSSIFNQFKNLGYKTSSYHNYGEHYYSRKTIHPNMGSEKYYSVSDLKIPFTSLYKEWPSDYDLIEAATPHFIDEDKFMVFMTMVTTHQPYSVSSEYGDKYLDKLNEYNYSKPLKRYLSKMFELDAAIGLLLDKLEESGKLENTVIALFGDHYPYGLSTNYLNEYFDYDVKVNNEVDRTPLIIYNSGNEPQVINKYTSLVDLLPTILNLFNTNYDPRLYLGNDIFSEYKDYVAFADGSWQDSIGFYSSTTGKFTPNDENITYTEEEIIEINNEINTKQKMSALAIKNNYFNYLKNGIDKYPKVVENLIAETE